MGKSSLIKQLRACAAAAKTFVTSRVLEAVESMSKDLDEMDSRKADKPAAVSCVIPVSGWGSDSTAGYPKYYDIAVNGVTAKDRADVTLAISGLETAIKCGMCKTCETMTGKIRIRAVSVPTAAIAAEYWIEQGKG